MMVARAVAAVVLGIASATLPDRAQEQAKTEKKRRTLTKAECAARLAVKKKSVFELMVPERHAKKGAKRVDAWLSKFTMVQSEHYLVYTNGPRTTVKRFAKSLEDLYSFCKERFPFGDRDELLECYVFGQAEEYFDFCVKVVGWDRRQARGTAGHATGAYYATFYQSPKAPVVMHEATHQIVIACMRIPGVGSWFQEGMAVWVAATIGNGKPSAEMRSDFRNGNFYALRDFVAIRTLLADPKGNGGRNYRHAGAFIDFLVNTKSPPIAGRFAAFLDAARRARWSRDATATAESLFVDAYGVGLAEVEALWKKHHRVPDATPKRSP